MQENNKKHLFVVLMNVFIDEYLFPLYTNE